MCRIILIVLVCGAVFGVDANDKVPSGAAKRHSANALPISFDDVSGATPMDVICGARAKLDAALCRQPSAHFLLRALPASGSNRMRNAFVNRELRKFCDGRRCFWGAEGGEEAPTNPLSLSRVATSGRRWTNGVFGVRWWLSRVAAGRASVVRANGDLDLVMLGDSITHFWEEKCAESWAAFTNGLRVANFGCAGDKVANAIWMAENGALDGLHTKAVSILVGTNDNTSDASDPEEVARRTEKLVGIVRTKQPDAKILLFAILPRGHASNAAKHAAARKRNEATNTRLAAFASKIENLIYVDLTSRYLGSDGLVSTQLMADGIHPTSEGYAIWAECLRRELPSCVKSDGWENANTSRAMPSPAKELWRAPVEKGLGSFRVEWRGGATGTVHVSNGAIRIEKANKEGMAVVMSDFDASPGSVVQGFAACYDVSPVDPLEAKAYLRIWSGREDMSWNRKLFNGTTADSPMFMQIVNTPPGHFTRKLCRGKADESGRMTAAIVVEGAPSVTEWRYWGAEDAAVADKTWKKMNASRIPPDRSDTMMDESAFDAKVSADIEHSARIAKTPSGGVLEIDGKPVPPIIYKPIPFGMGVPFTGEGRVFEEAGVNLQTVNIRFGVGYGRIGFWTTKGFDCAGAVRRVKDFMRSAPNSLFFVTIRCDAYPEYADEHPGEKWIRPDGTVVFGGCSNGERDAPVKPTPHTWPWISYHSNVWQTDVKRLMSKFVSELKRTGLAKRIVGVHLAGYHDGQFAMPVPDFSKPAVDAFRAWQQERFGSVKWNDAPSFPKDIELLDPIEHAAQIEYQKFLKWGSMRAQEEFARHLKKEFGKPIVVGRWCMNPFGGSIMGTLDFTPFTRSEALDFLVAQPHYSQRLPGLNCGVRPPLGSFRHNGKLFINEFDLRTWHGRSGENEGRGIFLSEATDLPMWESLHRKLAGQMFAQRMGWWYFDMADNWFDDPGIMTEIASVRRFADRLSAKSPWKPTAALILDEEGLLLRNRVGIKLSMREVRTTPYQLQDLSASAVPYDILLAQDFLDDPSQIDGYKVAVMCGFYCIDARRKSLIAALKRKGVKLVFLADSGSCGGAEACEGSVKIDEPQGLSPKMFNSLVRDAGGYVPSQTGIQVDMNGDFVSIHCLKTGHYDFELPFVADVVNVKTGGRHSAVRAIPLDMTGGETRWYVLTRQMQ